MARHAPDDHQGAPALSQRGERSRRRADDAEDVGLELTAVVPERQMLQRAGDAEAGVRDRDVEPAERLKRLAHRVLERAVLRHVALDRNRPASGGAKLGREVEQPGEPTSREDEVGALLRELSGERRADAGGGAGDQDDAARESAHALVRSAARGLLAEDPAQKLASPGPRGAGGARQLRDERDLPGQLVHGDLVPAELDELAAQGFGGGLARLERDVRARGL